MFAGETVRFVRMKKDQESKKRIRKDAFMSLCLPADCLERQLKHQARTAKVRILLGLGKCQCG